MKDLFTPPQLIRAVNKVQGVRAVYHYGGEGVEPYAIFKEGGAALLSKYFRKLPPSYTKNYYFEFDRGVVRVKKTCDATEVWATHSMLKQPFSEAIRKDILMSMFGGTDRHCWSMANLQLDMMKPREVTTKKLQSMKKVLSSLPCTQILNLLVLPLLLLTGTTSAPES